MATWELLSRTTDPDGETTTWLVDVPQPQGQTSAHDDEQGHDNDTARTDEGRY